MNRKAIKYFPTRIKTTLSLEMEAKSIEEMLRKALQDNEPIKADGAKLNYTERKDGVLPQYDIRTDRWEIALNASDKVSRSNAAKRHFEDFPEMYEKDENGKFKVDTKGNYIIKAEAAMAEA